MERDTDPVTERLNMRRDYYRRMLASGKTVPVEVLDHIRRTFPSLFDGKFRPEHPVMSDREFIDALHDFREEYGFLPRSDGSRGDDTKAIEGYLYHRAVYLRSKMRDGIADKSISEYANERGVGKFMQTEDHTDPVTDDDRLEQVKRFVKYHGHLPYKRSDDVHESDLGKWMQDIVKRHNRNGSSKLRRYVEALARLM